MNATSRPSSQLSQYGSSGYGSTRSHVGPHLNNRSQPIALLPKSKFSTLQTRTSKHSCNMGQHYPQFYSMRLQRRDQSDQSSLLIKDISPKSKSSTQEVILGNKSEVNNNSNDSQRLDNIVAPVPAPRKHLTNKSAKHTYQNVPIAITPNTQEPNSQQVSCNFLL